MSARWVLVASCASYTACGNPHDREPDRPPVAAPTADAATVVPIESLPPFAIDRPRASPYDCTPLQVVQHAFAGVRLESCGELALRAEPPETAAALACVQKAIAWTRPFLVVQQVQGTDSLIAHAFVALLERGKLAGYQATYDGDPCGGSCPQRGGTAVRQCAHDVAFPADCHYPVTLCFDCTGPFIESCWNGAPTTIPLSIAERARDGVVGVAPASLGPAFAGLQLGDPYSALDSPDAKRTLAEIAAGGIVIVAPDHALGLDARSLGGLQLQFAGPCTAIQHWLVTRWGAPADGLWIDPVAHQRARLELEHCTLEIERFADVADWVGDTLTAPIPLAIVGTPAPRGGDRRDDLIRWSALGIGRRLGPSELSATIRRGKLVELEVRGTADPATLDQLRARLITLRGPPVIDKRSGEAVWRGKPPISLQSVGPTGAEFELEIGPR